MRFRFTLRTLLCTVVLLSVLLACFIVALRASQRQAAVVQQLENHSIQVSYCDQPYRARSLRPLEHWFGHDWTYNVKQIDLNLDFVDSNAKDSEFIALLTKASEIRSPDQVEIALSNCPVPVLDELAKRDTLRCFGSVHIGYTRELTQREFQSLGLLDGANITGLTIAGHHCGDALGQIVAKCPRLRALTLVDTSITDDSVRSVAKHPSLEILHLLDNRGITAEGVRTLATLAQLRRLSLAACDLDADCLNIDGGYAQTSELSLARCKLNEESLAALRGWSHLENLYIANCEGLTPDNIHVLAEIKTLKKLTLSKTGISKTEADSSLGAVEGLDLRVYEDKPRNETRLPPGIEYLFSTVELLSALFRKAVGYLVVNG